MEFIGYLYEMDFNKVYVVLSPFMSWSDKANMDQVSSELSPLGPLPPREHHDYGTIRDE